MLYYQDICSQRPIYDKLPFFFYSYYERTKNTCNTHILETPLSTANLLKNCKLLRTSKRGTPYIQSLIGNNKKTKIKIQIHHSVLFSKKKKEVIVEIVYKIIHAQASIGCSICLLSSSLGNFELP